MSDKRNTSADEVYFVTLTISGWVDIFTREVYRKILVENLSFCQESQGLEIFEYVIMSNHIHLICRRRESDLKELLGRFKSYTSKELLKEISQNVQESRTQWILNQFRFFAKQNEQYKEYHVWDSNNYPVLLYSSGIYEQKKNYIHHNPVRAGIVARPEYYLYSSACPDSPLKCNRS